MHKFIHMLITRKLNTLCKICSPVDMIFHKTLSSGERIFSFTLHFLGLVQKQNQDLCTFSVGLAGTYCPIIFIKRSDSDSLWIVLRQLSPSVCPGSVNHTTRTHHPHPLPSDEGSSK